MSELNPFLLLLVSVLLASCAPVAPVVDQTPVELYAPSPTTTATLEPVPTTIPTLSADDARTALVSLLRENGGCQLPCLWDITPGKSDFQDVQERLIPFYSLSLYKPGETYTTSEIRVRDVTLGIYNGDVQFVTRVAYITYPGSETISNVGFTANAWRKTADGPDVEVFSSPAFDEQFAFYRLPNLLAQLGKPDSVLIKTHSFSPGDEWKYFHIVLLYPELGVFVRYTTIHNRLPGNEFYLGCPANAHVELDLFPSGNRGYFQSQMTMYHRDVIELYQPLEKATSMSLDEFYETFRVPTDTCIETSSRIWPAGND
jgi:hypothetical protein